MAIASNRRCGSRRVIPLDNDFAEVEFHDLMREAKKVQISTHDAPGALLTPVLSALSWAARRRWSPILGSSTPLASDRKLQKLPRCPPRMTVRTRARVSELLSANRLEFFAAGLAEAAENVDGIAVDHLS